MSFKNKTRIRLATVLLLGLSTLGSLVGSLALLTDTATSTNSFSVATVDITLDGEDNIAHEFAVLYPDTAYGDSYAVNVENNGSAEFRYAINTAGSTGDASWGGVAFKAGTVANAAACNPTAVNGGNQIGTTGTVATFSVGSASQGQQAGDRALAAGAGEFLCFVASHASPAAITGSYSQSLNFVAEQTASNP